MWRRTRFKQSREGRLIRDTSHGRIAGMSCGCSGTRSLRELIKRLVLTKHPLSRRPSPRSARLHFYKAHPLTLFGPKFSHSLPLARRNLLLSKSHHHKNLVESSDEWALIFLHLTAINQKRISSRRRSADISSIDATDG